MSKLRTAFLMALVALEASTIPALAQTATGARFDTPSDSTTAASTELRRAVLQRLKLDRRLPATGIDVTVSDGIVQLTGVVPVRPWKERAGRIARVVRAVRGVVNRVQVVAVRRDDALVARDVRQALRRTAALARMPIFVSVAAGVVELTGSITTWEEQQLAERVATAVPGVRFCDNRLTSSRALRRTSAVLAADVRSRLDWDPFVQQSLIEVVGRGNQIILSGRVASPAQRRRAVTHGWVQGVSAVDASGLLVDRALEDDQSLRLSAPTDAEISSAIQDLARYWPSVALSSLSISVIGGITTLRGNVPTLTDRAAVVQLVRSAVGVVEVRDELRGPWWRAPAPAAPPAPPPARRKSTPRARAR
jgi:osmotically-inducible protein OsmY